ncbi:MAG TPA: contractile injection system protein, VgrG/Pvc8 family, partial [Kofleriaceae bacterium]|nr:contractile injection system protein, VgrG/Pvc8 family [Kofleriaceae bacterium]
VLLRGMNKLHRLIRGKKSKTYAKKTDKEIIQEILSAAGIDLEFSHPKAVSLKYDHVYQHNQTDLEFVRTRVARIGAHLWCVGKKVFVKWPDFQQESGIELAMDPSKSGAEGLLEFLPRMNSYAVVKKVTAKGWNPETKELITGTASAQGSKLGSTNASSGAGGHGSEETFTVDQPIWSVEEANLLAEAHLKEASMTYVTGTAKVIGSTKFDLGTVIKLDVDADKTKDPFSGKYYIMGLTHHFTASGKDGFTTSLRLARDAQDA